MSENKIKLSNYVAFVEDSEEETFIVSARPVDKQSKYVIELESMEVLRMMWSLSVLDYGFWGRYTNFQERVDKKSKKVYVDITFQPMPEMLKKEVGGPAFSLELPQKHEQLMKDIFNQLNAQALDMEEKQAETKRDLGLNK